MTTTLEAPPTQATLAASVARPTLERGLAAVSRVAPSRTTLPVLACVRLDADGDGLRLTATDLDVTVSTRVRADVDTPGTAIVDAKRLADLVKLLAHSTVRLTVGAGGLTVEAGRSRTVLESMPADEWPTPPAIAATTAATVRAETLADLAHRVAFAVSTEHSRPILNGVLIEVRSSALRFVATNGHRLATATATLSEPAAGDADLIVPPRALDALTRLASEGTVHLTWTDNHISAETDGGSVQARLIEGPYPNWRQVVPESAEGWLTVDRAALIAATRRALVTAPDETGRIAYTVGAEGVGLVADRAGTSMRHAEAVEGDYSGEPIRIGFNGAYIVEVLSRITTDEVRFGLTAPERAVLVEPSEPDVDEPASRYLVMPLRLLD